MTLIEIMIVLAIIALIMGLLVGPAILKSYSEARVKAARAMDHQIEAGWTRWRLHSSAECPEKITDLDEDLGKRTGQPLDDPWGHEYVLKCSDPLPAGCKEPPCVYSFGPDGKDGTADDVKSWVSEAGHD